MTILTLTLTALLLTLSLIAIRDSQWAPSREQDPPPAWWNELLRRAGRDG